MTESKRSIGSDLAKVDAYENDAKDYEELPELDDAFFDRAEAQVNGKPLRGRPPIGTGTKQQVTLRLDPGIRERFRSSGPGWQSRMNLFLARNEDVLAMIVDFDEAIVELERLTDMVRTGGLRPLHETAERSIERIEATVSRNKQNVRALRDQLVWDHPPAGK